MVTVVFLFLAGGARGLFERRLPTVVLFRPESKENITLRF